MSKSSTRTPRPLEVLVSSYGGSGTNLLAEAINPHRCCITPEWRDRWCHARLNRELREQLEAVTSPDTLIPIVCIMADPSHALQSQLARGSDFLRRNIAKIVGVDKFMVLGNDGSDQSDLPHSEWLAGIEAMGVYFSSVADLATTTEGGTHHPLIAVKYESLPKYLPVIQHLLKIKRPLEVHWNSRLSGDTLELPTDMDDSMRVSFLRRLEYLKHNWNCMPTFTSNI